MTLKQLKHQEYYNENFQDFIPFLTKEEQYELVEKGYNIVKVTENRRKEYVKAYKKAINLIQYAPIILFPPTKT